MNKLIVFRKAYEYLFWLKPTVERFAKVHKYSLGVEMQANAVALLGQIVRANYADSKSEHINEALVVYELQRVYLRLAYEYKLINVRQFTFASKRLEEIGRLLRGWCKQARRALNSKPENA